jgi:hypothetical protein
MVIGNTILFLMETFLQSYSYVLLVVLAYQKEPTSELFDSGLAAIAVRKSFLQRFSYVGKFQQFCNVYSSMVGTVNS